MVEILLIVCLYKRTLLGSLALLQFEYIVRTLGAPPAAYCAHLFRPTTEDKTKRGIKLCCYKLLKLSVYVNVDVLLVATNGMYQKPSLYCTTP